VDPLILTAATGFGLGLASTLHCAGMCGGIASSLLLAGKRGTTPHSIQRTSQVLALTHAGRITAYVLAGMLIASIGTPVIGWLDRELAFRLAQWAGAVALMWIGLSTAGFLPALNGIDTLLRPVANVLARTTNALQGRAWSPFAAGLAWGLMPCAMVYGALFMAMLTGSTLLGGVAMMAFGLGTLPALLAVTLGVRALAHAGQRQGVRVAAGLAIGAFGFLTVWLPHPATGVICAPGEQAQLSWINFEHTRDR
jgi:hypothetical protein